MSGAIIYGGVALGKNSVVEEQVVLGKPEFGYAVKKIYSGRSYPSKINPTVIIRAGSVVYSGVEIGRSSTIGHGTLIRSFVKIGENTQLAHNIIVERKSVIGDFVRCSPLTHITSNVVLEDRVFLGAGVITINDKLMVWKESEIKSRLHPPYFEYGAKIGSGSIIAAGVHIGREAFVGSGSMVIKDVPAYAIVYGNPARVKGSVKDRRAPK